jgi:uncharacterized membrane protein YozB (DUF420 family)
MKLFKRIVVALTILAFLVLFFDCESAVWLREKSEADPKRQLWEPRFAFLVKVFWYSVLIPWMALSAIYFSARLFTLLRKFLRHMKEHRI